MIKTLQASGKKRFLDGYTDDERLAGANHLAPPSANVDITKTGEAMYRKGFIDSEIDLDEAGKTSTPFHVSRYNVTFFAINGKVKFVDHSTDTVFDTGLSLSETDGTKTMFGEYAGDIYLTNQTDGLRQIHMGRVNDAAATAGDGDITIDQDLAGRLLAFSDTSGTLRIATATPQTEGYASLTAAGVVTLSDTIGTTVPNDTLIYTVEDISSGRPKGNGITFWKERMIIWGVVSDTNTYGATAVDNVQNAVYMSKFAIREELENIISFDTSGTAAIEQVGKGGEVTAVLSTRDYLYIFTKEETYYCSVADVNATTGATLPQLLTNQYGCTNRRCAVDIGNGVGVFMTNNRRIIGIKIATDSGAPVVFPDSSFDVTLTNTVKLLDTDQADAFMFYSVPDRRLFIHCNIDSTRIVLKWSNEIQRWEPPTTGWSMSGMYVKGGVLYATDLTEDTIYQMNEGFQDNGQDYEVTIATSLIESEDGRKTLRLNEVGVSGRIGSLTTITVESVVSGGTPQQKSFTASNSVSGSSLGSVALGSNTLGDGVGEDMEEYDKRFAIYPTYGSNYQLRVRSLSTVSGGAFSLSSYEVLGSVLNSRLLTLQ